MQYREHKARRGLSLRIRMIIIIAAIITVGCARFFIVAKKETAARKLGYSVQLYREEEIKARRMNEKLNTRVAELTRATRLKECVKEYGIVLEVPSLEQVVHLKLSPPARDSAYAGVRSDTEENKHTVAYISQ
jgi:cell division protein FtsL